MSSMNQRPRCAGLVIESRAVPGSEALPALVLTVTNHRLERAGVPPQACTASHRLEPAQALQLSERILADCKAPDRTAAFSYSCSRPSVGGNSGPDSSLEVRRPCLKEAGAVGRWTVTIALRAAGDDPRLPGSGSPAVASHHTVHLGDRAIRRLFFVSPRDAKRRGPGSRRIRRALSRKERLV